MHINKSIFMVFHDSFVKMSDFRFYLLVGKLLSQNREKLDKNYFFCKIAGCCSPDTNLEQLLQVKYTANDNTNLI